MAAPAPQASHACLRCARQRVASARTQRESRRGAHRHHRRRDRRRRRRSAPSHRTRRRHRPVDRRRAPTFRGPTGSPSDRKRRSSSREALRVDRPRTQARTHRRKRDRSPPPARERRQRAYRGAPAARVRATALRRWPRAGARRPMQGAAQCLQAAPCGPGQKCRGAPCRGSRRRCHRESVRLAPR